MAAQATAVTDDAAPYEAIVRLAERELELAGEGRYEEIAQLGRERAQLLAALPRHRSLAKRSSAPWTCSDA